MYRWIRISLPATTVQTVSTAVTGDFCRQKILKAAHGFAIGRCRDLDFCSSGAKGTAMADHVYKKIELVGSSPNSVDEAVKNALARAAKTVRNMRWFEVTETRGYIEEGNIAHWQVTLKVCFTLEKGAESSRRIILLPAPGKSWWRRKSESPV